MPFRQRVRQFGKSVNSRLDALRPCPAQPSSSFPNVPGSSSFTATSGHPVSPRSKAKLPVSVHDHATNTRGEESSSSPTMTQTTNEITPLSRQAASFDLGQAQPAPLRPLETASNPVLEASIAAVQSSRTAGRAGWARLLMALDRTAGVFGPFKAVVAEFISCIEIYEGVAKGRDEFEALQDNLESLFEELQHHFSHDTRPTLTISMESLCKSILNELDYVKGRQNRGRIRRHLGATEDENNVLACYRRIRGHLERLSLNANLSLWEIVDERVTNTSLDRLCPSLSACYNSRQAAQLKRRSCTPGTRVDVLAQALSWVHSAVPGSVYWINGMAGTGKTTIAYSLCAELDAAHILGASFFCSRLLPECRDVNEIVPSIAYQLAHFSRPFRSALSRVLEKERNVHTQLPEIQFEMLVNRPLIVVRNTLPEDLVVVIDALDECDDKESTGKILEALLTRIADLPIKFFVASRPEPEIRDQMKKQSSRRAISRLVLHELDENTVQGDIEIYLKATLRPIEPSALEIAALGQRAGILFIYAATVARYIAYDNFGRNPRSRLATILSISTSTGSHAYKEIDELYRVIMKAAIDDPELDDQEREDMKQVLYTVVCAREPLTIKALSGLLGLDDIERVRAALRPLWSVLHVVESSELVTTLHASFPDYVFDPKRSKGYWCDLVMQNQSLARCCFERIKEANPQFNICGLESSYVLDQQVANLSARIEKAISQELLYACRYCIAHLERAKMSSFLIELLEDFLSVRLLLWMEIMNLTKCMDVGVGVIRQAEEWCMHHTCTEELRELTRDAWRFVAAFTLCPVSQSTPHIYASMLAFWPKTSPIAKNYARRIQGPMVPQGSALGQEWLKLLASWAVDAEVEEVIWSSNDARIALIAGGRVFVLDAVTGRMVIGPLQPKSTSNWITSIAFSADSIRIVSGTRDGVVCVWDARSGKMVLGPLMGHSGSVTSVAFSPNGTCIASGSDDTTIRIWDVRSGKMVLDPFEGHTKPVTSVAYSLDGTHIVSGSYDHHIRMWDTENGEIVLSIFHEHSSSATSVALSPDGTRIVSGSDNTPRVWDVQEGQMMLAPLEGHLELVTSVAFSPDGTRIASSSDDATIRLWDSGNGRSVLRPLEGHTKPVTSVAFSPDSTRIVSGSKDNTVRMWDTQSARTVVSPLEGHLDSVTSVAFSLDSTLIVSGSDDMTIRTWDARSGQIVLGPLEGHIESVTSVAFSSDGTRIVSGSYDKLIHIWDVRVGKQILGPLQGHTRSVTSVTFSPDGTRVISGSDDKTIRIWDVETGKTVLGPLEEHTQSITSVASSPNGNCIVSGSYDKTICMWDAQNGRIMLGPLRGHTYSVTSVAFSPDGNSIASGSKDNTICIWDARSGQMVLGPLIGHDYSVTSVAFSPDGTHIISGSYDRTIRMWEAQSGKTVLGPLRGHTDCVTSVAFSPDGTCIVSGSNDRSIRIWDARSGKTEVLPSSSSYLAAPIAWKINIDGWVVDSDNESRLLVWIPSDLRHSILPPRNLLSISTDGSIGLNFLRARIGEVWATCYKPY